MPQEIDTFSILGYIPTDRQRVFHDMARPEAEIFAILYGGAVGGGKSAAMLHDAIFYAANYPGIKIGLVRRTYPELEESFIFPLQTQWQAAKPLGARWNGTAHQLKFPNGSLLNFVYAETVADVANLRGGEYQIWYVDEASMMMPDALQQLTERLRSSNKLIPTLGIRMGSNPGGPSHQYLKDRFITPTDKGRKKFVWEKNKRTGTKRKIAFIPAQLDDNPHINEGYTDVIDSIEDPQRRKAMRDGDWDAMVGQFFETWSDKKHVIDKSFPLPKEWQRYCGIDYGILNPWAVIWAAVDQDGRQWLYREIYATNVLSTDQGKYILEAERAAGETSVVRVGDPAMWGNRGTPLTIADDYGLAGCGIYPADNDRINGWSLCHRYLAEGPACEYHKAKGLKTCPMVHVFRDSCPMFIRTIPILTRDPLKPEDAATKNVEDHIADAWRYLCMQVGTYARPVFYDDIPYTPSKAPEQEEGQPVARPLQSAQLYAGNWKLGAPEER